jgi:hypothetical protein
MPLKQFGFIEIYRNRRSLKNQLDELETEQREPFQVELNRLIPTTLRVILKYQHAFVNLWDSGRAEVRLYYGGTGNIFGSFSEANEMCSVLKESLRFQIDVTWNQQIEVEGFITLTLTPSVATG